jgi:hypothetical protein
LTTRVVVGGMLAGGILVALASACGPSSDAAERADIAERIAAIRRIPAADTTGRARAAALLRSANATSKETVAARDACADAYAKLAEVTDLAAVGSAGVRPSASADPTAILVALRRADELGARADVALNACSEAAAKLVLQR